ncbi:MAG: S41 family peptidase, partial [Promethearchaeota archaeon]
HFYVGYRNVHFEQNINSINPSEMGVSEYLEDFEYFYNFIRDNYPYLSIKERMLGYNWLDFKDYYIERITNATTNAEFLEIMLNAVQALQNLHTNIVNPSTIASAREIFLGANKYPHYEVLCEEVVQASYYWNGIFSSVWNQIMAPNYDVVMAYDRGEYIVYDGWSGWENNYNFTLGSKAVAVNGIPIDEAVNSCYEKSYLYRDFQRNKNFLSYISPRDFGSNAIFTIRNTTNELINTTFQSSGGFYYPYIFYNSIYPHALPRINYQFYPDEKIGYLYIREFNDYFRSKDQTAFLSFYNDIADYDYLIIDIRGNPGGSSPRP